MILKKSAAIPHKPPNTVLEEDGCPKLLIEQAKNGDDHAFGQLVEIYEKLIYNTACRTLTASGCSTADAEDIAQCTFLKAWRSLSAFRGDCAFSTWLYKIALNTAKDHIRSHIRHEAVSLTMEDTENGEDNIIDIPVTEGSEIPEDALDKKELILTVRRTIERLPEEQKQVIILRDIHELPYSDIAEMLGVEIGTVKSRINRGRQALKALLEAQKLF